MKSEVWYIPLAADAVLIYAPFHRISTLVNRSMAEVVSRCLSDRSEPVPEGAEWIRTLREPGDHPLAKQGNPDPLYLGLIPTRGCAMQCAYCDFTALRHYPQMSLDLIRRAVDGYAEIMEAKSSRVWNIHFFGGEPFSAFKEVFFAVNYARRKALGSGREVRFEVTTNGYYPENKARWIAENFDTVVLSLDGFPEVQNRHRPGMNGSESFSTVCRSADIFSRGSCELIIRSCVSAENAETLAEWAAFLADRFVPGAVCLEPMIKSPLAEKNGLFPPDPDVFVRNWTSAYRILKKERIRLVSSSVDISQVKSSLCPMGQDALIVSSEGIVGGCWQLAENQHAGNIDLRFGSVDSDGLHIEMDQLEIQRKRSEANRERCRSCFCYANCAGGCLLNRERSGEFCRMTKALTLWQLLEQLGYRACADFLLSDRHFSDLLDAETDFSGIGNILMDDRNVIDRKSDISGDEVHYDFSNFPFAAPVKTAQKGWVRDGLRWLLLDPGKHSFKVLEGEEGLDFQLEQCGFSSSDSADLRAALCGEAA